MLVLPAVQEAPGLNDFPVLYWNHIGLEMNRITHSLGGPQAGPTMSSRALGMLHLAMHDAYFAVLGHSETMGDPTTYLPDAERPAVPPGVAPTLEDANAALTGAAVTMLDKLYGNPPPSMPIAGANTMMELHARMVADHRPRFCALNPAFHFGKEVAHCIFDRLGVKPGEIGAGEGRYQPKEGPLRFREEPVVPLRRVPIDPNNPDRGTRAHRPYHGPFYGKTVPTIAATDEDGHTLADFPDPADASSDYVPALRQVAELGGHPMSPTTKRTADQTVAGLYWAYDGANLIGTPPRLYNQILRVVAWDRRDTAKTQADLLADVKTHSDFVRLFALANVAMADAGKFAWAEKYRFELWRPLSGIREHDTLVSPDGSAQLDPDADPFWVSLGAPETNTDRRSFKPPFPAYPSGHATFGAACFQMARLFYTKGDCSFDANGPDDIGFTFVSEELNGVSRDLDQPHDPAAPIEDQAGIVRTKVTRTFPSLWAAILENGISRIFLGVHWRYDSAEVGDIMVGDDFKDAASVSYTNVWTDTRKADDPLPVGGIPLGLGIANDIFKNGMKALPPAPEKAFVAPPTAPAFAEDVPAK